MLLSIHQYVVTLTSRQPISNIQSHESHPPSSPILEPTWTFITSTTTLEETLPATVDARKARRKSELPLSMLTPRTSLDALASKIEAYHRDAEKRCLADYANDTHSDRYYCPCLPTQFRKYAVNCPLCTKTDVTPAICRASLSRNFIARRNRRCDVGLRMFFAVAVNIMLFIR